MKARLVLLSLFAFVAAACSSGSSGGGGDNTAATPPITTPTASASTTPTATPSASPTPTPSFSSTVKASHRCQTAQLALSIGQGQGAAGSTFLPIVLTNKGGDPCTLYGYPGVSFLDENGNQLGVGATRRGGDEATVTLAPNGTANSELQIPDPGNFAPPGDCNAATSARLRVIPPNDKASLTIAYVASVCTTQQGATSVNPVTPGSGA